jgi:hypothetical protein
MDTDVIATALGVNGVEIVCGLAIICKSVGVNFFPGMGDKKQKCCIAALLEVALDNVHNIKTVPYDLLPNNFNNNIEIKI